MSSAGGIGGGSDPTTLSFEIDSTQPKKPFTYDGGTSPKSTSVLRASYTRATGYIPGIWEWRKDTMIAKDIMTFKVPALEARLQLINSAFDADVKRNDLETAANLVRNYTPNPDNPKELMQQIEKINPALKTYLKNLLATEFATGKPRALSEVSAFVSDMSDINFWQLLNSKDYERSRLSHLINSALFYEGHSINKATDGSGFTMIKTDAQGIETKLFSVQVHHNSNDVKSATHKISFTLEQNSSSAVIALADTISSTQRTGNSNSIKLTSVGGEPVAFLLLLEELVAVHNMHVVLSKAVTKELMDELNKLPGYSDAEKAKLTDRATILIQNATFFSPTNHNLKNIYHDPNNISRTPLKDLKNMRATLNALVATRDADYKPSAVQQTAIPAPAATRGGPSMI